MPPHAWSGQKKIAVTAIRKDGINYDQTFESTQATDMGGLREGNTASKYHIVALSGKNTRLLIEMQKNVSFVNHSLHTCEIRYVAV